MKKQGKQAPLQVEPLMSLVSQHAPLDGALEMSEEQKTAVTQTAAPVKVDWSKLGKKENSYTEDEKKKLEALYGKNLKSIENHDVVEGTVVSKTAKEVVIDIGYKSDGVVASNEFRYNPDLKPGDKVEVYIENLEDSNGQLILSHKTARTLKAWERVNESYRTGEVIQGFVKCRTKGGLIVDVFGIESFLPGSQIDVKPIRDYDIYVGKIMEFKVVKINEEFKNVVVSHKALIEAEIEQQKKEIISKLEKGQVLEGTVKNITSYGVFIDLGGVDGLIHITDLSWGRINHPEEIVKLDQKINVVILDFDNEKKRIALGLKQLTPHPWDSLSAELKQGDKIKGRVMVVTDYGAFVEIQPGIEGLIHVSEMSWNQNYRSAHEFLKHGEEVEAVILNIDRNERKISLGMKQLTPDPWTSILDKYPKGSKHTGTVRAFTNYGVFVQLEEGIDGMVHISDLSWSKKIKHPSEFTKVGEKMEVVVLEVNLDERKLSLGHKQLEENPWDVFETVFTVDSVHKATVVKVVEKGAIVNLPYGVEAFMPGKHMFKQGGETVKLDEQVDVKIKEFDKGARRIVVSHTNVWRTSEREERKAEMDAKKEERKDTRKAVKKVKDSVEKTTLGDIEALSNLKNEMEGGKKKEE